jgi:hypothetical protein
MPTGILEAATRNAVCTAPLQFAVTPVPTPTRRLCGRLYRAIPELYSHSPQQTECAQGSKIYFSETSNEGKKKLFKINKSEPLSF